jgi:hypothetical protein
VNEPQQVPRFVTFYAKCGALMLKVRVPRPRVERFVAVSCFHTSQVLWVLRQPIDLLRSIPGGFRLAEAEQLHPLSTRGERFLFLIHYALGYLMTVCGTPAYVWRTVRAEHRDWKARNAPHA